MPKKSQTKSEKDNDDKYWEDIFDSIDMDILPVEYINKIIITFQDKTVWDIDVKDSRKNQTTNEIEDSLETLFEQYEDHIESIDFRLDFPRVKQDLSRRVNKFLKLNK